MTLSLLTQSWSQSQAWPNYEKSSACWPETALNDRMMVERLWRWREKSFSFSSVLFHFSLYGLLKWYVFTASHQPFHFCLLNSRKLRFVWPQIIIFLLNQSLELQSVITEGVSAPWVSARILGRIRSWKDSGDGRLMKVVEDFYSDWRTFSWIGLII